MAEAIARAIETRGQLLAEAGTGTGKTFAYLVPALLSGGKVIVSTGTKTLQDQLFQRDLPLIRDALKVPVSVALLKGRGNYVCHHHLERASDQGTFAARADAAYLPRIVSFARTSTSGDKGELADVPENAGIWADVTSTRENCLGSECAHYDRCFVMSARKQALAADVVVINHHLFFADVMLKDEGLTELLPACNTVILDEAHQLPDTATLFFGEEISAGSLGELARDAEAEGLRSARDYAPLPDAAQAPALEAPTLHSTGTMIAELPSAGAPKAGLGRWLIPLILVGCIVAAAAYEWYRGGLTNSAEPARSVSDASDRRGTPTTPAAVALPNPLASFSPAAAPPATIPQPVLPAASMRDSTAATVSSAASPASVAPGDAPLLLTYQGPSWTEIRDRSGQLVVSRLVAPGSVEPVRGVPPFDIVLGNAHVVTLVYRGKSIDLSPHTRQNVARLTLR